MSAPFNSRKSAQLPLNNFKRTKKRIFGINYNDLDYFAEEVNPNKKIKFSQLKFEEIDDISIENTPDINDMDVDVEMKEQISSFLNDDVCYVPITPPMSPTTLPMTPPPTSPSFSIPINNNNNDNNNYFNNNEQQEINSGMIIYNNIFNNNGNISPRLNPEEDKKRIEEYMKREKELEKNTAIDNILKLSNKHAVDKFYQKKIILIPFPTMRKYTTADINIDLMFNK